MNEICISENIRGRWNTVSAQIRGRRLIKKLGFYGEILLNKMLRNWQILLNKVLGWRFNQEWPPICADTVETQTETLKKISISLFWTHLLGWWSSLE